VAVTWSPRVVVTDIGGTIATGPVDPSLGQRPIDLDAADALRALHAQGVAVMVASNTTAEETRWPALHAARLGGVVKVALLSAALGVAKPDPLFYRLVLSAAGCAPGDVVFVGDNPDHDVYGPARHGMRTVLVRPAEGVDDEPVPTDVPVIARFSDLPQALREIADREAGGEGYHVAGHEGVTLECPLRCVGLETVEDLITALAVSAEMHGLRSLAEAHPVAHRCERVNAGCPVGCLELSGRVREALRSDRKHKARTVGDLLRLLHSRELGSIDKIGPRSIREVQTALVAAGFSVHEYPYLKF
jgi:hypothetical protein